MESWPRCWEIRNRLSGMFQPLARWQRNGSGWLMMEIITGWHSTGKILGARSIIWFGIEFWACISFRTGSPGRRSLSIWVGNSRSAFRLTAARPIPRLIGFYGQRAWLIRRRISPVCYHPPINMWMKPNLAYPWPTGMRLPTAGPSTCVPVR